MASSAFPHRRKFFVLLAVAPLFIITFVGRVVQTHLIPLGATWPFMLAWFAICTILSQLMAPSDPLRDLPQPPKAKSIFGHAAEILVGTPKGGLFLKWIDNVPNEGLIRYDLFPFGLVPSLVLTSPEVLQEALVTRSYESEKPLVDRLLLQSFIGRGLIVVEGAEHKMHRKSATPAFSGKQINNLVIPVFWKKSKELTDVIADQLHISLVAKDNNERSGIIDMSQWASQVTLDIIGLACVGKDFCTMYNTDNEIVKAWETLLKPDSHRGTALLFQVINVIFPPHIARLTPFFKHVRDAAYAKVRLRVLCHELLETKRRDMEAESSKHIDILSVFIRSGQFTDDGLVDQLLTFLAAGHETTAGALTWTLYLLAINPAAQEQLRQELRTHFGHNEHDAVSSLESLAYLNAVISEQLRLYPGVPTTGREAMKDMMLGGQFVPKGTTFIAAPWAINRSKTHWGADAEEYKPERWLQEDAGDSKKSPMSLITFSHGPRSCIGQAFSRAELRCLVAAMVMRFEMEMADPSEVVEPAGLATIKPKNGMRLRLKDLSS